MDKETVVVGVVGVTEEKVFESVTVDIPAVTL